MVDGQEFLDRPTFSRAFESFVMSDKWEMYFSQFDEDPAAVLVDLGIAETIPDAERPKLLWMSLQMKSPDENGFASEEEEDLLTKIEDTFIDAVELTSNAILVGRITTAGRREFYFYSKTEEGFDDTIAEAMEQFEDYTFETGSEDDEEWGQYQNVLYPGAEDQQQIFNRQTIDQLTESGDVLTKPRPVDHFANFPTPENRTDFVTAVSATGNYIVIDEDFDDDPDCEMPYGASIQRVSPVDWDTIEDITIELFDLARENDGEYEGWGSQVVRE